MMHAVAFALYVHAAAAPLPMQHGAVPAIQPAHPECLRHASLMLGPHVLAPLPANAGELA
jgi:hypothetical protein